MKCTILFLYILLLDNSLIEWRTLNFTDFKGQQGEYAAQTATSIELIPYQKDGRYLFLVKATFLPEQSYCRIKTDKVLAHEQLHFDITELYARKIRSAINKHQDSERIYRIYDSLCLLKDKMQEDYDRETEHSVNGEMQQKWNLYIRNQLK